MTPVLWTEDAIRARPERWTLLLPADLVDEIVDRLRLDEEVGG